MKLKVNSWHYRMWEDSYGPHQRTPDTTDLCRYCHRVFWQLMARLVIAFILVALAGGVVFGLGYKCLYQHPLGTLEVLGIMTAIAAAIVFYTRWLDSKRASEPTSLLGKWMQARKQKVCPVVEFDES